MDLICPSLDGRRVWRSRGRGSISSLTGRFRPFLIVVYVLDLDISAGGSCLMRIRKLWRCVRLLQDCFEVLVSSNVVILG